MRRRLAAALCILGCLCVLGGCGKEDAEVAVPQVEVVEEPQISQTEEQKEAELGLDTQAGTELGEEEITVMTDEGEPETAVYTRVRGIGDFSIAYDAEEFTLTASENELRFEPVVSGAEGTEAGAGTAGDAKIFLSIRTEEAPSAEELADQYVAESNEECTVIFSGITMCCTWLSLTVPWRLTTALERQSIQSFLPCALMRGDRG